LSNNFSSVLRKLALKDYVDLHGKSGDAVSLSRLGVFYVKGKIQKQ
jgi:hypothetical protein